MEIEGYPNYLIYEDGKVWSKHRNRFLKQSMTSSGNGYLIQSLNKDGKKKWITIHRLVALHYIPNPDNKPHVDHINRIKTDNRVENLRWVTRSENSINTSCRGKIPHKNVRKTKDGYRTRIKRNNIDVLDKAATTLEKVLEHRDNWFIENGEEIPD